MSGPDIFGHFWLMIVSKKDFWKYFGSRKVSYSKLYLVYELYKSVFINFGVLIYLEYCFRIRLRSERTKKEVNKEVKDQSNDQMKEKCTKGRS